ncbi:MAG: hypothetical protein U5R48_00420 [Gammaproteobacteria bacterium]|nr:hypothetical protein [Gammaproteobacteria bacterium]
MIAGVGIDRIRLNGTASRAAGETRADLRLAAGALDPGVPMTDLACGLQLEVDGTRFDDCSAAPARRRVPGPHGCGYDPETGSGAVPRRLIGLDRRGGAGPDAGIPPSPAPEPWTVPSPCASTEPRRSRRSPTVSSPPDLPAARSATRPTRPCSSA